MLAEFAHGFLAGWCYWATNLFYVPVLLVYMAGIFAYAGGEAQAAGLAESRGFVATLAFGWLVFMAIANVRGASVGKWIHNIGGASSLVSVVLVVVAAGAALAAGVHAQAPAFAGIDWETATSFAVMCNALVGVELASTMGDEIRDPDRDLGPAVARGLGHAQRHDAAVARDHLVIGLGRDAARRLGRLVPVRQSKPVRRGPSHRADQAGQARAPY